MKGTPNGTLDLALRAQRNKIARRPDDPLAHFNLAKALRGAGRLREAEAAYRRAIQIQPDFVEALVNLGNVLQAQDKSSEAERFYRRALEFNPASPVAGNALGSILLSAGRLAEARASFERALAHRSEFVEAHNNLGVALMELGRLDEAEAAFRQALRLRPRYPKAFHNLAMVHRFAPGDDDLAALERLAGSPDLAAQQRTLLHFAQGKAQDDLAAYDSAFAHFTEANRAMAALVTADPERYRARAERIRTAYQRPFLPAAEPPTETVPIPVFVIGMSRSGKSLVERLLKGHPAVHAAGERSLWALGLDRLLEDLGSPGRFPEVAGSLTPDQCAALRKAYFSDVLHGDPEPGLIVNTWPGHLDYVGLIFEVFPTAKVICCTRGAMDNCLCVYFKHYASGNHYSYDLEHVGAQYRICAELAAHWQALYGTRVLSVSYEALVRDPQGTANEVFGFCGLDRRAALVDLEFNTDEIDSWQHYEAHIGPLVAALGPWAAK